MSIRLNVDRAKTLQRSRMRKARLAEFAKADADYMKALETSDTTRQAEVVAKKQQLRDCTQQVTDANITATDCTEATNQLKAVWNEDLLGPYSRKRLKGDSECDWNREQLT